ncbi:Hsp20 family protein [Litorivicinus lipolyticus]|uniref:Hsp20 family protein n=1 Tax=Litorivicinus lipolyticus TaxID=418701 RepID=A0A5Q2Q6H9_9GAMM|nr:Hsp20 family protein [Litorivicinus lipolyticus]QGG79408.1 Hsp20 family protein [Litorivicinus lipolyticus]
MTIDFTPLYRSSVGFDRLASMLESASRQDVSSGYPHYNIEITAENSYTISLAVAGFDRAELSLETHRDELLIKGKKALVEDGDTPRNFLHRGIAQRNFERKFQLAEHVRVTGANLEHGILHIELVREVPEALKPRQIEIAGPGNDHLIESN